MRARKLILKCFLAPGDIVMLTAAVRDLHACYPGRFLTDVRTSCPELWENNPYLTSLNEGDPGTCIIECQFPLVNHASELPYHFIHGFIQHLSHTLDVQIRPTAFHGDIHISNLEKGWISQVHELAGQDLPIWIVAAGGKYDYTAKWWETRRYQEVIDHFRGKIQFVQVGDLGHYHPKLKGVIDLRGKTTLRELVRLVYHSQGVLCPVTSLMHLAAAVPVKGSGRHHRACVVVAGAREPVHWEAYPFHQFIHTIGSLPCCAHGPCWRSRTFPLEDGDELDRPENLCVNVVGRLARCMDLITSAEVIRRIEVYYAGGTLQYLSPAQTRASERAISRTKQNSYDEALTLLTAQPVSEQFIANAPEYPGGYAGRGIVICGGGLKYFPGAWVCINMLRRLGCRLPIQLWFLGKDEVNQTMRSWLRPLGVECVNAEQVRKRHPARILKTWELKPYALLYCPYREVLLLDADNVPVVNPEFLFETPEFRKAGAIFWPDLWAIRADDRIWRICGIPPRDEPAFESGQVVVDKVKCWKSLLLTMWYNEHSDFFYQFVHGDKETFHLAFRKMGQEYAMPSKAIHRLQATMCQHDFEGRRIFQHRNVDKWALYRKNKRVKGFAYEKECLEYLRQLRSLWDRKFSLAQLNLVSLKSKAEPASSPREQLRQRQIPITLVSLYDHEMYEVARITSGRLREYAARHGYRAVCHTRLLDPNRHPSWNKILALRKALAGNPGAWVMWCDADAIIVNMDIRLEDLIPHGHDVVFTSDVNGLNAGVFFMRSCPWSLQFLETIYTLGEINYSRDRYGNKWEQNTIKHLLDNFDSVAEHVAVLPPYVLSSDLERLQPGDFILHLMGQSNEGRLRALRQLTAQGVFSNGGV